MKERIQCVFLLQAKIRKSIAYANVNVVRHVKTARPIRLERKEPRYIMAEPIRSKDEFITTFLELDQTYGCGIYESYSTEHVTKEEIEESLRDRDEWIEKELMDIKHYLQKFNTDSIDYDPDIGYHCCLVNEMIEFLRTCEE